MIFRLTSILITGIPFFDLPKYAKTYLDLYEACDFRPTREHSLVQEWAKGLDAPTHRVSKVALRELFEQGNYTDPAALDVSMS